MHANVQLVADIAVIKEVVERMDRRLFGNGQPGEIQILRTDFSAADNELDVRLKRLERGFYKAVGAIILIAVVLEAFGHKVLGAIMK